MIDTAARLRRYYVFYIFGFIAFVLALWGLEGYGMPPRWIGYAFLCMTILLYATIGILARTPMSPSTTLPAGAFRRSSMAWRPAPTG